MTTQNARLNQAQTTNDQLRAVAMQMALQARQHAVDEPWEDTLKHAQDIYEFMRVPTPSSLTVVSAAELPGGSAA